MKKRLSLIVSLIFLLTCSIEMGRNLDTLLEQEVDTVLFIETDQGRAISVTQEDLLKFDYSIDDESDMGVKM